MRQEPKESLPPWNVTDGIAFMLTYYDVWSATPPPMPAAGES